MGLPTDDMEDKDPAQASQEHGEASSDESARPQGRLLDELDRLSLESNKIRIALRSELKALLETRDGLATDLMVVEREIATRLAKVRLKTRKPPERKSVRKPKPGDRIPGISTTPAVPVSKSIQPDAIVCLIDGVRRKMLHRHLKATYGISPEEYRVHFDLPQDYPMTAPGYSKSQSKAVSKAYIEGRFIPGGARRAMEKQAEKAGSGS